MAAYLIVELDVHDGVAFADYRARVPGVLARYGGKYLARGGNIRAVEGDWLPSRMTVMEFPSMERFQEFYDAPDYAELLALRKGAAETRMVVIEGV